MSKALFLFLMVITALDANGWELPDFPSARDVGSPPAEHSDLPVEAVAEFHESEAVGGEYAGLDTAVKLKWENERLLNLVQQQGAMIELLKSRIKILESEK